MVSFGLAIAYRFLLFLGLEESSQLIDAVLSQFQSLRACILCGGQSRRMGSDKAQLVHPSGGVWLTALVDQLLSLSLPVMVLSGHPAHQQLVAGRLSVSFVQETWPGQGPLQALARVLAACPGQPLFVLPVDMPCLNAAVLQRLLTLGRPTSHLPQSHTMEHAANRCLVFTLQGSPINQPCSRSSLVGIDAGSIG